jgi:hypothetical protein
MSAQRDGYEDERGRGGDGKAVEDDFKTAASHEPARPAQSK